MEEENLRYVSTSFGKCSYFPENPPRFRSVVIEYPETYTPDEQLRASFRQAERGAVQLSEQDMLPICPACNACISLRVNVSKFSLSASQSRLLRTSGMTDIFTHTDQLNTLKAYALFKSYIKSRHDHTSSSMVNWPITRFEKWFTSSPYKLVLLKDRRLAGFSHVNGIDQNMVLHYSAFNPAFSQDSPGKQLWLRTVLKAQEFGIDYVYVGQWAKDSPKLDYKKNHNALEAFIGGKWVDFDPEIHTCGPNYKDLFFPEEP